MNRRVHIAINQKDIKDNTSILWNDFNTGTSVSNNTPRLISPITAGGDTALFGGFNPAFYDGYQTEYPLQTGWEERQKLCQLYPLLVHALLFGGNYVQQSKALLDRFF